MWKIFKRWRGRKQDVKNTLLSPCSTKHGLILLQYINDPSKSLLLFQKVTFNCHLSYRPLPWMAAKGGFKGQGINYSSLWPANPGDSTFMKNMYTLSHLSESCYKFRVHGKSSYNWQWLVGLKKKYQPLRYHQHPNTANQRTLGRQNCKAPELLRRFSFWET